MLSDGLPGSRLQNQHEIHPKSLRETDEANRRIRDPPWLHTVINAQSSLRPNFSLAVSAVSHLPFLEYSLHFWSNFLTLKNYLPSVPKPQMIWWTVRQGDLLCMYTAKLRVYVTWRLDPLADLDTKLRDNLLVELLNTRNGSVCLK